MWAIFGQAMHGKGSFQQPSLPRYSGILTTTNTFVHLAAGISMASFPYSAILQLL